MSEQKTTVSNVGGGANDSSTDSDTQISKMILFIQQEAEEKAREIKVKAQGDAIKEQGRMILEETQKLNEAHEKRMKQAEITHKIKHTSKINEHRLKLFKQRETMLGELYNNVEKELVKVVSDEQKNKKIIAGLLLQAMYGLVSEKLLVRCTKKDFNIVKGLIPKVERTHEETAKLLTKLEIDENNFLPESVIGGVVLLNEKHTMKVDNTLKEKLTMLYDRPPPKFSKELFGEATVKDAPNFQRIASK